MSNYQSALKRIKKAKTVLQLQRLENSLKVIYEAGQLTVREYMRLDLKLVDKMIEVEK